MNARFISSQEKKKILQELDAHYGIAKLPYLLLETGKQKIRGFSGSLSKDEITELAELTNVEIVGMYLISLKDRDPRVSFDALPLFKDQISKNHVEIGEDQLNEWLKGNDLSLATKPGVVVLIHNKDCIGVGKSNGETVYNYVPKERKRKS